MKRILIAVFLYFGMTGTLTVFAAEPIRHKMELGTEISHITYEEPGVMEEKGVFYGVAGSYTYRDALSLPVSNVSSYMLKVEGRFAAGEVDYTSSSSGSIDDIDDYLWEARGLAGYDFSSSYTTSVITPYTGIGYRYLNDDGAGKISTTGGAFYERESNYLYSPIGIEIAAKLEDGWSIGGLFEYDYFWWGKQKSHMGILPGYYDIENDQEKGYGLRGSLKLKREGKIVDFIIEPFIRYWDIKDSEVTIDPDGDGWIEPENNSTEYGLGFKLVYAWPDSRIEERQKSSHERTDYEYSRQYDAYVAESRQDAYRRTAGYSNASDYYNAVKEQLAEYASRGYVSARGKVDIDFTIASDGSVKEAYAYADDPELQDFAREAVINAAPYPRIPEFLNRDEISFNSAIVF
ncbi:MAG: hypothetical protein PHR44_05940 [Candidatus Omnitrophica bacterium]|nr:hypothetical protein [Candidatus Omnitrophota bacterium]